MRLPTAFCVAWLLAAQAASTDAWSQENPAERAASLFLSGRDAMKRSEYAAACAAFAESQALDPSSGTLLNLAVCEERLGRLLRARDLVREFIRSVPPTDDRGPRAVALAAHLDERIPTLVVDAPADLPAEAQLLLDEKELSRDKWHGAVPVESGEHDLVLNVPGYEAWHQRLTIAEGEKLVIAPKPVLSTPAAVKPQIFPPENEAHPPTREAPPGALPTAFWFSAAVGGVGLGVAATSGILALVNRNALDDHCVQKRCDAEGLAAADRGEFWATVNTVAIPIGLVGTALATYLFVTSSKTRSPVQLSTGPHSSMIFVGSTF
jgi:hypothetical protein